MQCSRGHQNQDNAVFCVVCGEQLGATNQAPAFPPPPPSATPYGQAPMAPPVSLGYGAYPNPGFTPGMMPQNGKGTTALVMGILGLFLCPIIFSILAIIFGVQGKALADQGKATNRGAAQAGFVLGIIGVAIGVLLAFFILVGSA